VFEFFNQSGYCNGADEGNNDIIEAVNDHEELLGPCGNKFEHSEEGVVSFEVRILH